MEEKVTELGSRQSNVAVYNVYLLNQFHGQIQIALLLLFTTFTCFFSSLVSLLHAFQSINSRSIVIAICRWNSCINRHRSTVWSTICVVPIGLIDIIRTHNRNTDKTARTKSSFQSTLRLSFKILSNAGALSDCTVVNHSLKELGPQTSPNPPDDTSCCVAAFCSGPLIYNRMFRQLLILCFQCLQSRILLERILYILVGALL